jgi:hypothetical protein
MCPLESSNFALKSYSSSLKLINYKCSAPYQIKLKLNSTKKDFRLLYVEIFLMTTVLKASSKALCIGKIGFRIIKKTSLSNRFMKSRF